MRRYHYTSSHPHIAEVLAAMLMGTDFVSPGTKPTKVCRNKACGREHRTGKPCCSAECYRAWRAKE